jgi:hypothetical protein
MKLMGNRERIRMVPLRKKTKRLSNFLLGVARSISLRKKQCIIMALERNETVKPMFVRPHTLLNYYPCIVESIKN